MGEKDDMKMYLMSFPSSLFSGILSSKWDASSMPFLDDLIESHSQRVQKNYLKSIDISERLLIEYPGNLHVLRYLALNQVRKTRLMQEKRKTRFVDSSLLTFFFIDSRGFDECCVEIV